MTTLLTYINTAIIALYLIAGGWVAIRNWFQTKAAAKVEEAETAAKEQAEAIEAAVQERLKKLQAEADSAPEATATSTTGSAA